MHQDARGLALTAASDAAARGFDHVMAGYLAYRLDTGARLKALLAEDPDCPLALVMAGSFAMLAFDAGLLPRVAAMLARAEAQAPRATARERAHVAALAAWHAGDLDRTLSIWEGILAEHPQDLLAFRLHHFNAFWLGRRAQMLSAVEGVLPRWSAALPGWSAVLACRAFAHEECGSYTIAEQAGRAAVALDPADLWATHAVAHVLEMQGRRGEGIDFLSAQEPQWEGGNNLRHHLFWHRALYHLERREWDQVLALYDRGFRDLASPVTAVAPDLYIDVQNAASMLLRLELRGIAVGDRWEELAQKAEARVGDTLSAFTQPHWMMALAATGRFAAADRLLAALEAAGQGGSTLAPILRDAALPACRAILHHRRGEHAEAVAALRPALGHLQALGGSHAQQEILDQVFLDSAMKAGLESDARLLLERAAASHPIPLSRRQGYASAAAAVPH